MPMPEPPSVPPSVRRLTRWGEAMQKTYGGFAPAKMKANVERRVAQVTSVPKAAAKEVKVTAKAMEKQAQHDVRALSTKLKKLGKRLGL